MNSACKTGCILLMFWMAFAPVSEATATESGTSANALAKTRIKAKVKAVRAGRVSQSARLLRQDPVDEASLDREITAARAIVTGRPNDAVARERLAHAAAVLIDWLLRAEAVGNREKAERLGSKLKQRLQDTGWRVQSQSQRGDLLAKQATGFLLGRGIFLKTDTNKACAEFLAAAEKLSPAGWHAAQCMMEAEPEKAWVLMERAAEQGHAAAQEWMGRRCLGEFGGKKRDLVCARSYLVQSASLGRPKSQTLLAYLLATGQGGPVDMNRAINLYKLAAGHGDVDALNNLGEIYEVGRGVPSNPEEALRWYQRAAEKGLGSAQFNAGRMWATGLGEKNNAEIARGFLLQAEANGVVQARQMLDWLDLQGIPSRDDATALKSESSLNKIPSREASAEH